MSGHEPPHDGPEEPLPEPELPAEGELVVLARPVEMTADDGRVTATVPSGTAVTFRGALVPGGHEFEVSTALPVTGVCTVADLRTAETPDPDGEEEGR